MKKNGKRREYGKEIGGLYAGKVGNRKGDFLKREICQKGNMVDGNVVKDYT